MDPEVKKTLDFYGARPFLKKKNIRIHFHMQIVKIVKIINNSTVYYFLETE